MEDRVKTCIDYNYCMRCLLHGHAVGECACRHIDNRVMCGSTKYHQQLHGSKNRLVNLINRSTIREAIDEPDDKIDFGMDETLLQDAAASAAKGW